MGGLPPKNVCELPLELVPHPVKKNGGLPESMQNPFNWSAKGKAQVQPEVVALIDRKVSLYDLHEKLIDDTCAEKAPFICALNPGS